MPSPPEPVTSTLMARGVRGFTKGTLAVGGILAAQILHAAHRPDLPSYTDQALDGVFGEPGAAPLRIVFAGDSTVTAPGVEPIDDTWPRRVARHLARERHVELIVTAVGGSKARDVLEDQMPTVLGSEPDIVVLSVGGNDALRGTPIRRFEAHYDELVGNIAAAAPLIACGVGDLGTIPRLPALAQGVARVRGRSVDRAIARIVARHRGVLKTNAWGPRWAPFETDLSVWAGDLFHASGAGHALYADETIPLVERLLNGHGRP